MRKEVAHKIFAKGNGGTVFSAKITPKKSRQKPVIKIDNDQRSFATFLKIHTTINIWSNLRLLIFRVFEFSRPN